MTELSFIKDNIEVEFIAEEMESYFVFRIVINKDKKCCISDNLNHWREFANANDYEFVDIFNYTSKLITESAFNNEKNELFRKSQRWFFNKKHVLNVINLYKELLKDSMDNILTNK